MTPPRGGGGAPPHTPEKRVFGGVFWGGGGPPPPPSRGAPPPGGAARPPPPTPIQWFFGAGLWGRGPPGPPVCAVARSRFTRRGGIHPSRAPASTANRHGRVKTLPYKLPGNVRLSKHRGPGMPGPYRSVINKNPGTLIPCVPGKVFSAYFSCAANSCGAAL